MEGGEIKVRIKMSVFRGLLIGVALLCLISNSNASDPFEPEKMVTANIEKIKSLLEKYPDDPQLHLGVAEILHAAGSIPNRPDMSEEKEYRMVLRLDPQNLPARQTLLESNTFFHFIDIDQFYKDLEWADKEERGKIEYPPGSMMYDYIKNYVKTEEELKALFKDMSRATRKRVAYGRQWLSRSEREKRSKLTDEDIEKAIVARREKLKEKSFSLIRELDKAQQMDPNNAPYNYLKAALYFVEGEKERAVNEVKEGLKKDSFTGYPKERLKAKTRVLEEINFPWPQRGLFLLSHSRPISWEQLTNVLMGLIETGKDYEYNNKPKEAENIYKMILSIGAQMEKNSLFMSDKIDALWVKKRGYKSLEAFYQTVQLRKRKDEVSKKLKDLDDEEEALFALEQKACPQYERILDGSKAKEFKAFVGQVIEKGELEVLKPE